MRDMLMRAGRVLLDLLYPPRAECMGCGDKSGLERDWLCLACRQALAEHWAGALPPPEGGRFQGAAFAYYYSGPAGTMVRNLKYRGVRRLAEPMGRAMASAFKPLQPTGVDCVAPVPMHPRRLSQRGFNHAALLAAQAADRLELPVLEALERVRDTSQQARLQDAERRVNVRDAFAVRGDMRGRRVLLVDDVCTTGATANACADALLAGGVEAVYLLCFAKARKRDGDQDDA